MITLTVAECRQIVAAATKSPNVAIIDYKATQFGDFLGFLGEYYQLTITATTSSSNNNNNADAFKFFAKSLPIRDVRGRREMLVSSGIFEKETKIYENLIGELAAIECGAGWCARCFLARDDLLVFDDLTLAGFDIFPRFDFDVRHVEATLRSLAALHAASIVYERSSGCKIGTKFAEILFETSIGDIPWFRAGLRTIQEIAGAQKIRDPQKFYASLFGAFEAMEESPFGVPFVLCHRDVWRNNLMFSAGSESTQCRLIDFQTARYLPLTVDVNMAVVLNTTRVDGERLRGHFLAFYYAKLGESLERHDIRVEGLMSFESFRRSCEHHKRLMVVYKAIAVMLTHPPAELFNGFTEAQFREFGEGDRYAIVRRFMDENEEYRLRLEDAVDAIVGLFC